MSICSSFLNHFKIFKNIRTPHLWHFQNGWPQDIFLHNNCNSIINFTKLNSNCKAVANIPPVIKRLHTHLRVHTKSDQLWVIWWPKALRPFVHMLPSHDTELLGTQAARLVVCPRSDQHALHVWLFPPGVLNLFLSPYLQVMPVCETSSNTGSAVG